ncbi:hypothetical protein PV327_001332 [Microctonus hyperodae]|uniref:Uncharacterized protein n=1 Tax=Microctonus hyperodae TaxID=165561 RepID=A0AA39G8Z7_MICHY|nr:hypothetical protein PV327_001332 [Microctonus hyperodae]
MAKNSEMNLIIILSGLFCFFIITEARYKVLNVQIKNGDEIIELKWKRTEQYLVNENLPVWLAKKDTQPIVYGMGRIIAYQDIEKSSAVIYMSKFKVFYGIIDTRFYIARLPFDELLGPNIYHDVKDGYIFSYDEKNNENSDVNQKYNNILIDLFRVDNEKVEDDFKDSVENDNLDETLDYDDIISQLNQDDVNAIKLVLNSDNEEDNIIVHGEDNHHECQVEDYYDDILAKLTEHEENTKNPMTDVDQNREEEEEEQGYDDILSNFNEDELNLINSIIDSSNIPSTSGLSSQHMIQHDVGHDTPSTSVHVSQIESITQPQNTVVHDKKKSDVIQGFRGLILRIGDREPNAFPYGLSKTNLPSSKKNQRIHADKTLFKFMKYIEKYRNIFPEDSFDVFFVSTNYAIQKNSKIVPACSRSTSNILIQRRRNAPYLDLLGSIVGIKDFRDFIFATRAVTESLGIGYDPSSQESEICSENNCHIMQKCSIFNQKCLKWSRRSQHEFEIFLSSNTNRCFLLNYPRSLRIYNLAATTIDPKTQCLCYGFEKKKVDELYSSNIVKTICHKQLLCIDHNPRNGVPPPIDGTPCEHNMVQEYFGDNEHEGKEDEESEKQEPYCLRTSRNNLLVNRKSFIKFKTLVN